MFSFSRDPQPCMVLPGPFPSSQACCPLMANPCSPTQRDPLNQSRGRLGRGRRGPGGTVGRALSLETGDQRLNLCHFFLCGLGQEIPPL